MTVGAAAVETMAHQRRSRAVLLASVMLAIPGNHIRGGSLTPASTCSDNGALLEYLLAVIVALAPLPRQHD